MSRAVKGVCCPNGLSPPIGEGTGIVPGTVVTYLRCCGHSIDKVVKS